MVLPNGMSGRALADTVLARFPGLPVLFTTGYIREGVLRTDSLDPNMQLLGKPYTLEGLARKVRDAIDAADNVIPFKSGGVVTTR